MSGMHAVHKMLARCARHRHQRQLWRLPGTARLHTGAGRSRNHQHHAQHQWLHGAWGGDLPRLTSDGGCLGIVDFVAGGEQLEIDTVTWQIRNLANGRTIAANPVPRFFQEMVELGGEKAYLKARIAREAAAR